MFGDSADSGRNGGRLEEIEEIQEAGEDDTANINMSNLHDLSSICCEDEENVSMSRRWSAVSTSEIESAQPHKEATKTGEELPFSIFMD